MQQLNFDQLRRQAKDAGGGDPIPNGEYPATVATCEFTQTNTGKPMLKLRAKVNGGPHEGRTIWDQLTLSTENDNAVAIFLRHLKALGLSDEFLGTNPSFDHLAAALVGKSAVFVLGQKTWQGKQRNEVKDIRPLVGVGPSIPQVPNIPTPAVPTPTPDIPIEPQTIPVAPPVQDNSTPAPPKPPF